MLIRIVRLFVFFFMVTVIASCGGRTYWSKAGADNAQMLRELSQCRQLANTKVEKEYRLTQESMRDRPSGSDEDYRTQMMTFSALKRRKKLTEYCMQQSGYQKIKEK